MFQCGLNIELYFSRAGKTKYLFQYVCEASDRVAIKMVRGEQHYNEIGQFQDVRYNITSKAL